MNQLVLLINFIGLLLIDPFLLADISITQNIPEAMEPGSEVRVTVTVNKAELTGFAKLQLDLPAGMTATAIETMGASFTFSDQKAKFIWMALPSTPSFKVTYTLSADAYLTGNQAVQGRFSYIEDNERKTFDLPTSTVEIKAGTGIAGSRTTADPAAQDLASAGAAAPAGTTPMAVIDQASGTTPMQGAGGVTGVRTITPVTENELLVEVVVKKGDLRGFGKLQETVPQGFSALEKNSGEAIFTTQDRIVKFVWLNMPAGPEMKVVYKLRANERPEGEYSVDGEFGYLLNDETQKAVLGTSKFFVGPKALEALAETKINEAANEGAVTQLPPVQPVNAEEPGDAGDVAQDEPTPPARNKESVPARSAPTRSGSVRSATAVPAPETGVVYKVQIIAAHREVGRSYFTSRHGYNGDFSMERHQGWIKYVTGRFGSYAEARDQRVALSSAAHAFPGPFVTAYNNGDRITVQEALVLSNQKWVQ